METERDPREEETTDEAEGALNEDNPTPPDDAGQRGAGSATGGIGGREHGTEPDEDED
jgi:hypothetical protein